MEKFEPKEHESDFTKFNKQEAEEAKEKIKELNEKFKKIAEEFEKVKKKSGESFS